MASIRSRTFLPSGRLATGIALTSEPGAKIRYTTDGSAPSLSNLAAHIYQSPIMVTGTTTLRAVATRDNYLPSPVSTRSFLFSEDIASQNSVGRPGLDSVIGTADYDVSIASESDRERLDESVVSLPVVSLALDELDMFGPSGLYNTSKAQGSSTERRVSVEYFDPRSPTDNFVANAGIRIHGGYSRVAPKRSFRIYFRPSYGLEELRFPLFGDDYPVQEFKRLVLRGGAHDAWNSDWPRGLDGPLYARDQLGRSTHRELGHVAPAFRYVQLFINGLYWGLYDLSERPDAKFAASHFGGDTSDAEGHRPVCIDH